MIEGNPEDRLIEIWADSRIRGLARQWARDTETAEDALQSTYIAIMRRPNLAAIENLRSYFVTVLRRECQRQQGRSHAFAVDDFNRVADQHLSSPSFEDGTCSALDARARYARFRAQRDRLVATVAARSTDKARYRAVIGAAAERILLAGTRGESSAADLPPALRDAYPEYFAEPGVSVNTCDQRYHRARRDVRKLLVLVLSGEDIS